MALLSEDEINAMNLSNITSAQFRSPKGVLVFDGGPIYQVVVDGVPKRFVVHHGEEIPEGAVCLGDLDPDS